MSLDNCKIQIKLLRNNARIPTYATSGSAAADLYAALESPVLLFPGEIKKIPTGIAISLPDSRYGAFIFARSGLSVKKGLCPANAVGVIDSDYRGEVIVALQNHSSEIQTVQPGERIAQLCILPVVQALFELSDSLDQTDRGTGGFGSTGV